MSPLRFVAWCVIFALVDCSKAVLHTNNWCFSKKCTSVSPVSDRSWSVVWLPTHVSSAHLRPISALKSSHTRLCDLVCFVPPIRMIQYLEEVGVLLIWFLSCWCMHIDDRCFPSPVRKCRLEMRPFVPSFRLRAIIRSPQGSNARKSPSHGASLLQVSKIDMHRSFHPRLHGF